MFGVATEAALLKKIAKGDQKAFETLFNRHSNLVFGYAMRILGGDNVKAEDVSQTVWMNIVRYASNYEERSEFRAWLKTLVRNTALNVFRSESRRMEDFSSAENAVEVADETPNIEQELLERCNAEQVKGALNKLPESQRVALVIWMTEEPSYEDMAEQMRTTVSSIKSLLFRAKKNIEEELKRVL